MRKNKNMPLRVAMIVDEFMPHVFFLLMYILVTILCVCVCVCVFEKWCICDFEV